MQVISYKVFFYSFFNTIGEGAKKKLHVYRVLTLTLTPGIEKPVLTEAFAEFIFFVCISTLIVDMSAINKMFLSTPSL